jgi:hypothetical protein
MKELLNWKVGLVVAVVSVVMFGAGFFLGAVFATLGAEDVKAEDEQGYTSTETVEEEEQQEEPETKDSGLKGYSLSEKVTRKGVTAKFEALFAGKGRAVALVKVTNNTKGEIEVYPDQDGKLSIDGKQITVNGGDSYVQNDIMPGATAEEYISFPLPDGVNPDKIKEVQVTLGDIWLVPSQDIIEAVSIKVTDLQTKKDPDLKLEEGYR